SGVLGSEYGDESFLSFVFFGRFGVMGLGGGRFRVVIVVEPDDAGMEFRSETCCLARCFFSWTEITSNNDVKKTTKSGASFFRIVSMSITPLFKSMTSTEPNCMAPSATPVT